MQSTPRTCALFLWVTVSAMAATNPAIDVRFSNQSSATDRELADLEATTRQLFAKGEINISWSRCFDRARHLTPDPGCQAPAGPAVVVLSLVDAAPTLNPHVLGIGTLGTGRATLLYMRARMIVSKAEDLSVGQLLGHAAAHEIVHLLLGPNHSASGVMRETVSPHDLVDIAQGHRWLGQAELDQVRSALLATQTEIGRNSKPSKHSRLMAAADALRLARVGILRR
jgi:hypothetical protein